MDNSNIPEIINQVSEQKEVEKLSSKFIFILGIEADGRRLKIPNNGYTKANSLDQVTWIVVPGLGVREITRITPKPDNPDLFIEGPKPLNENTLNIWTGKLIQVDRTINEAYDIEYVKSDGSTEVHDPIIQLNP